jgi:hypothetical protein
MEEKGCPLFFRSDAVCSWLVDEMKVLYFKHSMPSQDPDGLTPSGRRVGHGKADAESHAISIIEQSGPPLTQQEYQQEVTSLLKDIREKVSKTKTS